MTITIKLLFAYLFTLLVFGCSIENVTDKNILDTTLERYDNGDLKRIGNIINGKKTGEWKLFINHSLVATIEYKDDKPHGKETWFNKCSGRIIEEGNNELGRPIGLWYRYSNGKLVAIKDYDKDAEILYQNPKFSGDGPPPPPKDAVGDCDDYFGNHD